MDNFGDQLMNIAQAHGAKRGHVDEHVYAYDCGYVRSFINYLPDVLKLTDEQKKKFMDELDSSRCTEPT
jgi:hypothetical protein